MSGIVSAGAYDHNSISSGLLEGDEQFIVELESGEIIAPDGKKTFTFSLPEEWTPSSRMAGLGFCMCDTSHPDFISGGREFLQSCCCSRIFIEHVHYKG